MKMAITQALLMAIVLHQSISDSRVQEVCDGETFEGRCESGQVMVMESARYGRMRLGRCVKVDLGYLGCSSDVVSLFDRLCSGKPSCDVFVSHTNEDLATQTSCVAEILSYIEAESTCVTVANPDEATCKQQQKVVVTKDQSMLSSHVTDETSCGGLATPWVIQASPGQRVSLSMWDFGYGHETTAARCQQYGFISEPDLGVNETLCGGMAREKQVYVSSSSHVVIQLLQSSRRQLKSSFLLRYLVIGCPDIKPPSHAWYKRDGHTAVIGCEWSEHSWHLKCEGNTWVGVVGNCSSGEKHVEDAPQKSFSLSPLLSVSLIIGLGVLVVVLFCVALIGGVCMLRSRNLRNGEVTTTFQPSEQQQAFLYHPGRPVAMTHPSQTQVRSPTGKVDGSTLGPTKTTTTDELIHIWETPLPIPKQAQSSTAANDTSTAKSDQSTLPGPPHVYKDGSTMSRSDYSTDTYWAGTDRYFDNDLGWVTMPPKA